MNITEMINSEIEEIAIKDAQSIKADVISLIFTDRRAEYTLPYSRSEFINNYSDEVIRKEREIIGRIFAKDERVTVRFAGYDGVIIEW